MKHWTQRILTFVLLVLAPGGAVAADSDASLRALIMALPKAELHVHIEGTLEPEHYLELIARNGLTPRYASPEAVRQRLTHATDLNTFIEVFSELLSAMRTERDFHDVALTYFRRVRAQQVVYVEMFFDPQMHTERGIPLATVFAGLLSAKNQAAEEFGLRAEYIMCFNRDRSAESAAAILEESRPWHDRILGIGLDNPEERDFPRKFAGVFARARELGLRLTSHCDVNQPNTVAHIWGCLDELKVERIDHGINVLDDPKLIAAVRERRIGLTVCPTLLYAEIPGRLAFRARAIKQMLDLGLLVTINSDDPGMMRSLLVGDLFWIVHEAVGLTRAEIVTLAANSFEIAWLPPEEKRAYLAAVQAAAK